MNNRIAVFILIVIIWITLWVWLIKSNLDSTNNTSDNKIREIWTVIWEIPPLNESPSSDTAEITIDENIIPAVSQEFARQWLGTDTSKKEISLDEVRDWWPWKDGIPTINNPQYIQAEEAKQVNYITNESLWIVVSLWEEHKFFPYSILNWHEIVNDSMDWIPVSVTFCPLCWSAIVFDRRLNWEVFTFWVSWLLRESNLLMYDTSSETLWSQALWKWVIWKHTWKILNKISSDVISFEQFSSTYPKWLVLSDDTWYNRDYTNAPYWDYDVNDTLYFPVSNNDTRLPKKEILYVVNDWTESLAFVKKSLSEQKSASITVWEKTYKATVENGIITVNNEKNRTIPWYHEMWFSRVTHNPNSKNIWIE